ncbi:hypothetical protein D6829_00585 [Candidatus Pacearchaeota archaeon]|nr:MAG: hypothetical protein D6829_00585 [Candidatus Pacearchaeota archaeon]
MKRGVLALVVLALGIVGFYAFGMDTLGFFTGKGVSGTLDLFVQESPTKIHIYSPENKTYSFDVGQDYNLSLNVSANFTAGAWNYSLYDLRHDRWVNQSVFFTPNTTFLAVRWGNRLTVSANDSSTGQWYSASVVFTVSVPNSAPILGDIPNDIFVCENNALSYDFNASDIDEDTLYADINPKNPFYVLSLGKYNATMSLFRIFSGELGKGNIGTYEENISVRDDYSPSCCSDSVKTNITVIEINNNFTLENLGAQTVWTRGENSTFYHVVNVSDVEDGNASSGNFTFEISFSNNANLFAVSPFGVMNYTPDAGDVGVYSVLLCVNDSALQNPHENISLCAPEGAGPNRNCDTFTLTVTDNNRAPEIVNYSPSNQNLKVSGDSSVSFYVEVYDADGTVPDIDWYIDGVRVEHNENRSNDSFVYKPGCGVSGTKKILALTTDGLLNDSVEWEVNVSLKSCSTGGGGGGGSSEPYCREQWGCSDWRRCINVYSAHLSGIFAGEEYFLAKEICSQKGFDEDVCGYQRRKCRDVNECNNTVLKVKKPEEFRVCYFIENPGCNDGIQNCHDGGCEFLVDCGGPCAPCPTCSDGIKNQNEEGIDCGGPCPFKCRFEEPKSFKKVYYGLILIFALIVILAIRKLLQVIHERREIEKKRR